MVIGIQLVLVDFLWIHSANGILRQLLAISWIQLAHLRSLSDSEPLFLEIISSLNGSFSRRGPDCQWFQRNV